MNPLTRLALASGLLCLVASRPLAAAEHQPSSPDAGPSAAVAVLVPGGDSHVRGTVRFTPTADGVRVQADVSGLTPGTHGFHIHEKGDLSKPDLTSAGGHFNPEGHPHAARTATPRHVGDLGNLEADQSGHAMANFVDSELQLSGPHSIVGRAVIIHAKADDLKSQPAGDAGGRVAGGVIGIAADSLPAK